MSGALVGNGTQDVEKGWVERASRSRRVGQDQVAGTDFPGQLGELTAIPHCTRGGFPKDKHRAGGREAFELRGERLTIGDDAGIAQGPHG